MTGSATVRMWLGRAFQVAGPACENATSSAAVVESSPLSGIPAIPIPAKTSTPILQSHREKPVLSLWFYRDTHEEWRAGINNSAKWALSYTHPYDDLGYL